MFHRRIPIFIAAVVASLSLPSVASAQLIETAPGPLQQAAISPTPIADDGRMGEANGTFNQMWFGLSVEKQARHSDAPKSNDAAHEGEPTVDERNQTFRDAMNILNQMHDRQRALIGGMR